MRKLFPILISVIVIVLSASKCEKYDPDYYRDIHGNKVLLVGKWGLTKVEYRTAGVIESKEVVPSSLMEFMHGDKGRTISLSVDCTEETVSTFHYEVYRGSVTLFTEKEWENNRDLSEDDSAYERGRTYAFKVLDEDTIFYEEKISGGSSVVNYLSRR